MLVKEKMTNIKSIQKLGENLLMNIYVKSKDYLADIFIKSLNKETSQRRVLDLNINKNSNSWR